MKPVRLLSFVLACFALPATTPAHAAAIHAAAGIALPCDVDACRDSRCEADSCARRRPDSRDRLPRATMAPELPHLLFDPTRPACPPWRDCGAPPPVPAQDDPFRRFDDVARGRRLPWPAPPTRG